jgi:hypothetical protein
MAIAGVLFLSLCGAAICRHAREGNRQIAPVFFDKAGETPLSWRIAFLNFSTTLSGRRRRT